MPLFHRAQKTPAEICKGLKDSLQTLASGNEKKQEKASEEVGKYLQLMKTVLQGAGDQPPQPELVAQLAHEVHSQQLLHHMLSSLAPVDFESKKDIAIIFTSILRRQIGNRHPTVDYVVSNSDLLFLLIKGYEQPEVALNCGLMLRECARHEPLAKLILNSPQFYRFFDFVEVSTFDIASDAFATFKELLVRHKILCSEFLETNYDRVFTSYTKLLNSENYVTKRQALKLLGELLLDRHNFTSMTRYISNPDNLKLMMNLLRERSRNIQFEAFHVFKVFVANPSKPKPILDILTRNRERLIEFLSSFHTDRSEDEQFTDEREYLIKQIRALPAHSSLDSTE